MNLKSHDRILLWLTHSIRFQLYPLRYRAPSTSRCRSKWAIAAPPSVWINHAKSSCRPSKESRYCKYLFLLYQLYQVLFLTTGWEVSLEDINGNHFIKSEEFKEIFSELLCAYSELEYIKHDRLLCKSVFFYFILCLHLVQCYRLVLRS